MLDATLIKDDDNLVALQRVPCSSTQIPEMFDVIPPPEPSSTTTAVAPTTEGPPQTEADVEIEPTTTTTAPKGVPTPTESSGMFMCQRLLIRP